ncbi:sugar ABC transporter substrate-binding protein [Sinorhizobium mexicanum]|uniref:Substrate-binding domain-containing protein n=1 Tax=Sinorhizobium mexicanum TaxID=375549 RepID=A0A859QRU7_9HYPH|nr:sugar ABC transporter substrate-binding protein [Sinorhizobium mexicanum]MBP1884154.1 ribose transport system substrate-binding protein [Sinorhizobium mexicanum]QLL64867.1 substrate-binding domain-containing protein [Sinorhizobium mexicanum]
MISRLLKTTAAAAFGLASILAAAQASEPPEGGTVAAVENTKGPIKIAFLSFQNNPFWTPVTEGAKAANKYLENFNATVDFVDLGNELSAEAVVAGIEGALAKQYNGIVVVPIFDGTARIINEATEAGVPVFNIVAEGAAPSERLAFIGQDAASAGEQIGKFIQEKTGGKGKLGVITGYFGATQHTQRMNGALDYLKANAPDLQVVGPFENKDKAEEAYSLVQDMVTSNPDLSMVYVTAGGPFGAAKAIKDLGLTGKIGVVGFDHTPDNMAYLKTGEMVGLLDQAPYQQALDASVMLYNYLVAGTAPPAKVIPVVGKLLTPADAK